MSAAALWTAYTAAVLFAFGAVVGSFLNVCIHRLPLGESVVRPRSACPRCGAPIRWQHNVPILSYLVLRGRCADCGGAISPRYPLVEAGNALLWLVTFWRFGLSWQTLLLLPFVSAMLVLFFTDYDHKLLPNRVTYPLALAGLLLAPWNGRLDVGLSLSGLSGTSGRLIAALAGAAAGYGSFFLLALLWRVLFDREALGGGDLKMMLGVGAFLGVPGVFLTIFLASLAGTVLSLPGLLTGRWSMTKELPFGCFLAPAAVVAAFWGAELARWYAGLLPP